MTTPPTHVATFACRYCQAPPFASLTAFLAHVSAEHGRGPTPPADRPLRLTLAEWRRTATPAERAS